MTDREKALKGIECCEKRGNNPLENQKFCGECPYYSNSCVHDLLNDIKELLKKQESAQLAHDMDTMAKVRAGKI